MPEPQETKPETPAPKKKGPLGCSFPVFIIAVVILLTVFVLGLIAGPIGQAMFKGVNMPAWMSVPQPKPELPAETVFHLSNFPITNSIIATWLTMLVLIGVSLAVTRKLKFVPGRLQALLEFIVNALLNFCQSVAGKENGRKFFPVVATIFLFVIFNGWLSLLPIFGSIGVININSEGLNHLTEEVKLMSLSGETEETLLAPIETAQEALREGHKDEVVHNWEAFIEIAEEERGHGLTDEQAEELIAAAKEMEPHLLRGANTDINTPLAIALFSFFSVWFFGFKMIGPSYIKQFINVGKFFSGLRSLVTGKVGAGFSGILMGIIDIFIGLIEFLSQCVRLVSFTLRLFGNMTAGEILLLMATFLVPFFFADIFYGLEILVGFVQALIFGGLTLIFLTVAATPHEHKEHHAEEAHK